MKKTVSKFWQYWQRFWEPNGETPFIIKLSLGVLAVATVAVTVSESATGYLQQLLTEKHYVLETIGYCVVGVVSMWLAWAANKRANAIDATAKEQAKATANTEAGQRQERLKNAIEHLGHGSDSVRMGGAHELFHLAKDTEDLRQTVLDILCAHIRQTTRGNAYQAKHKTKPSEEIQSLLTLLFAQEHDVFKGRSINLQGSYLNGANLSQARLKKANLREAQLQEAYLNKAQIQEANLWSAQLQYAYIWDAQIQGAILVDAQMQGARLMDAKMQGAILRGANLQKAILSSAEFQGAILIGSKMQGAFLINTNFQGAILTGAKIQEANLWKTQLQGVNSTDVSPIPEDFESRIRDRVDMFSDLTGIIFAGGLKQKDLDTPREGLSDDQAQALQEKLGPHVGQVVSNELPADSGAAIGVYTQEEAEQWIAEYKKAMQKTPRAGDN